MRLIDADALKEFFGVGNRYGTQLVIYAIDSAPTIDPVKHGYWIKKIEDGDIVEGQCSKCQCDMPMYMEGAGFEWNYQETDYCPNCGARMDEKGEEQ